MADVATSYELTSGSGTLTFNDGTLGDGTDKYWLANIQGLDGPVIRAPVDLIPFGDGGIIHTFRKGPRRVVFDGMILIESSRSQTDCMPIRNTMLGYLDAVLQGCLTIAGTLTWTPSGASPQELEVFYEVGLNVTYSDNYAVANFSFGLISASSDPVSP